MKIHKIIWGLFLILTGILIMLFNFGIKVIPTWDKITTFWPVFLIVAGILIVLKNKLLAILVIFLMCLLLVSYGVSNIKSESIEYNETIKLNESSYDLKINYGANEFIMKSGSDGIKIDSKNIKPKYKINKNEIVLDFNHFKFNGDQHQSIVLLDKTKKYSIDLNYGASDTKLDFRDINVEKLSINAGMMDTHIKMGSYDSKISIDTGMSDTTIIFPKDVGYKIFYSGGMADKTFEDSVKKDNYYLSNNYDKAKYFVEINIDTGMSDITVKYE
jgi:hypothetical protein